MNCRVDVTLCDIGIGMNVGMQVQHFFFAQGITICNRKLGQHSTAHPHGHNISVCFILHRITWKNVH